VLTDSSGWPCLRFEAVKVRAEQLIPLSAKAAAAIAAQQDHVRERWPAGSPWLFPGTAGNQDGSKPYSHSAFSQQLRRWQRATGLRDEAGQPVTVTGHQFRHTLGTRLINSGVPQHVAQKLLGHYAGDPCQVGRGWFRYRRAAAAGERLSSWPISAQVWPWSRAA
jgi:integrase